MASVYAFWLRVFGATRRPRCVRITSPRTSRPPPASAILYRRSAVSGVGWWPSSTSPIRPSKTASARSTAVSVPCSTISFPRTMTSHSTSSSTRLKTESRSPKTSSIRPGGMTSFASTWVSVFSSSARLLQPVAHQGGQLPSLGASSGEGHGPSHDGPHVLHPTRAGLLYGPVHYLFQLFG